MATKNLEPLSQLLADQKDTLWELLDTHGFAVIDNVLGEEWCTRIRTDIKSLVEKELLEENGTRLTVPKGMTSEVISKRHLYGNSVVLDGALCGNTEEEKTVLANCPSVCDFFHTEVGALTAALSNALPELSITHLDEMRLQYNAGKGGCFPMHFDSGARSQREMTCIVYLNDAYEPGHGGELRVYPFPQHAVDIPPTNDRMVIFCSNHLLHRVLPNQVPRYVLSMWFAGEQKVFPSRPVLPFPGTDAAAVDEATTNVLRNLFGNPTNRLLLAKVLYEDEWARSTRDAFAPCESVDNAMELHHNECATIATKLPNGLLNLLHSCLPLQYPFRLEAFTKKRGRKPSLLRLDPEGVIETPAPGDSAEHKQG